MVIYHGRNRPKITESGHMDQYFTQRGIFPEIAGDAHFPKPKSYQTWGPTINVINKSNVYIWDGHPTFNRESL